MVKRGGVSWHTARASKTGVRTRFKCAHCGRQYKMEHAKNTHEEVCKRSK